MPSAPRWTREALAAGVWCASAVSVAGYTYHAFKASLAADTQATASGSGPPAIPTDSTATGKRAADSLVGKIPLVGKPLVAAGSWLQNIFSPRVDGASHLSGKEIGRLQSLPGPPSNLVSGLKRAQNGQGDLATAANRFAQWANRNGWQPNDISSFFTYLGIVQFGGK